MSAATVDWMPKPREASNLLSYLQNDHGNSQRIIAVHGHKMRYCHELRKWLVWDGQRWAIDTTEQAHKLAKDALLRYLDQAIKNDSEPHQKFARQSLDSKRVTCALRECQPEIFFALNELDASAHLLNFQNGTLDLRTASLMTHDPAHKLTKLVRCKYQPGARCDRFLRFLRTCMGDREDASDVERDRASRLVGYLQRSFGYSLTGETCEKAVFILHGEGGDNGKTTLLSVFLELLKEYSTLIQIETVMVKQQHESANDKADKADLCGARFVMTSETEEGQRLSEGQLKRITQGMGVIKATRKYENPIIFPETHKLWIDANHLPKIRGTDNAIWNRLHPIPFLVSIPPNRQDKGLRTTLLDEGAGILAWAVEGATQWYANGLGKPAEVVQANATWRQESDQVSRFIADCCVKGNVKGPATLLYEKYKRWVEDGREKDCLTQTAFGSRLGKLGFDKTERAPISYIGLGLRAEHDLEEQQ